MIVKINNAFPKQPYASRIKDELEDVNDLSLALIRRLKERNLMNYEANYFEFGDFKLQMNCIV